MVLVVAGVPICCRWHVASEAVRWTAERAALLTDHNSRGSHGPNPLWLLSLTPPHPPPISSAHVGLRPERAAPTFSCLSPLARRLPFPFNPPPPSPAPSDYLSRSTSCTFCSRPFSCIISSLSPPPTPPRKPRASGSARALLSLRLTKAESLFFGAGKRERRAF